MRWKKGGFYKFAQKNAPHSHLSNLKLINDTKNKETYFENLDSFFYKCKNYDNCHSSDVNNDNGGGSTKDANHCIASYYLPTVGITNLKLCEPNELIFDQATIFFRILDAFKVPYALFAGSSIGLLRNEKTLPFVDDYDIIIFNKHVPLLINAVPVLKKHGFKIIQTVHSQTKQKTNGGCSIYSYVLQKYYNHSDSDGNNDTFDNNFDGDDDSIKKSYFLCDVFFSYFDENGFLRNNAMWGLYHGKNIHMKEVVPFQRRTFDGLRLPFFKDVASEVQKCYGNVEQCIIKSHGLNVSAVYRSWKTAHTDFERIKQNAKENTMQFIFYKNNKENNENESEEERRTVMNVLDNTFSKNSLDVLRGIYLNKTKIIYSFSMEFIIRHAVCIKYYFPAVQIEYFSYSRDSQVIMFLNYVDVLHVYNNVIRDFYNDPHIIYLKKPRIDIITVVTFGTFFHDDGGKDFSILTECAKYSENIWIGLSSEPLNSFNIRSNSIKRYCPFVKRIWKYNNDDYKYNKFTTTDYENWCAGEMCGANLIIIEAEAEENEQECVGETPCCIIRVTSKFGKNKSVHFY